MAGQSLFHHALRYGLVGLVVLASDFAAYAAVLFFVPHAYLPANLLGKAIGAAVGFVLHKHFTFSWDQAGQTHRQAAAYLTVLVINLASSTALLWLLVSAAGMNAYLAKLIVDAVVIATSFLASRLWVYRPA